MLYTCAARFDVTRLMQNFWKVNKALVHVYTYTNNNVHRQKEKIYQ